MIHGQQNVKRSRDVSFNDALKCQGTYVQKLDKIMEKLHNIGKKLFVLAALKEH